MLTGGQVFQVSTNRGLAGWLFGYTSPSLIHLVRVCRDATDVLCELGVVVDISVHVDFTATNIHPSDIVPLDLYPPLPLLIHPEERGLDVPLLHHGRPPHPDAGPHAGLAGRPPQRSDPTVYRILG
jgi:hypothetical protein